MEQNTDRALLSTHLPRCDSQGLQDKQVDHYFSQCGGC